MKSVWTRRLLRMGEGLASAVDSSASFVNCHSLEFSLRIQGESVESIDF